MSGASPNRHHRRRDRPSILRTVLVTVLVSFVVIAAGYGVGLLVGRVLL